MKKCASIPLCLLLAVASAQADPIAWSFDASNSTKTVPGDAGNLGAVSFATMTGSFAGNQSVRIAQVFASTSPVPGQDADTFSGQSYNAVVDLTDTASGDLGVFSFTGHISGSMNASSASLSGTFDNPMTVHHTLGGHDYAVTIGPFVSPTSPTANGELDMSVAIDTAAPSPPPPPPPPPTHNTPEPPGVVLGALGLSAAGALLWRRRRAVAA